MTSAYSIVARKEIVDHFRDRRSLTSAVYRDETDVWTFLTRPAVLLIAWVGTAVAAAWAVWYRRRLRRELENLLRLRRELEGR
jgi:cell division protein FtsL